MNIKIVVNAISVVLGFLFFAWYVHEVAFKDSSDYAEGFSLEAFANMEIGDGFDEVISGLGKPLTIWKIPSKYDPSDSSNYTHGESVSWEEVEDSIEKSEDAFFYVFETQR